MIPVHPKSLPWSKRESLFREYLGLPKKDGKYKFFFRSGITGLEFHDVSEGQFWVYQVSIETHEKGLMVYCRYYDIQKWVIIPFSTLKSVHILKKPDIIRKIRFSWFFLLQKLGIGYRPSRKFILEKEWVRQEKLYIILENQDQMKFILQAKEKNHGRIIEYFSTLPAEYILNLDVKHYECI